MLLSDPWSPEMSGPAGRSCRLLSYSVGSVVCKQCMFRGVFLYVIWKHVAWIVYECCVCNLVWDRGRGIRIMSTCRVHNVRFYDLEPRAIHCMAYESTRKQLALSRCVMDLTFHCTWYTPAFIKVMENETTTITKCIKLYYWFYTVPVTINESCRYQSGQHKISSIWNCIVNGGVK
jgi:hypothetical protein